MIELKGIERSFNAFLRERQSLKYYKSFYSKIKGLFFMA